MSELDVQPRVNSESISNAFEQELRGDNDLALADRGTGGAVGVGSNRADVATPTRPRLPKLRPTRPGYSDDPLMAADEDPEDSWLIPSPGPLSERKQFDMSPPKEELGNRKRLKSGDSADTNYSTYRSSLSGKREENGNSAGKKLPSSPAKSASRIPRVAQLSTSKPSQASLSGVQKSPQSPAVSQFSKSSVNSKAGGAKKLLNSTASDRADSVASSASGRNKGQSDKLKAAISGRRPLDSKRDSGFDSRNSSRPGSASSVNSARTTVSQRPPAKKTTTPPSARSGTANGSAYAAANASRGNRRSPADSPGSRRTSRMGNETAAAPAELLTAISGPEEDLEELAKPVQGKQMDEQVTQPVSADSSLGKQQPSDTGPAAHDSWASAPDEETSHKVVSIPVQTTVAKEQPVEEPLNQVETQHIDEEPPLQAADGNSGPLGGPLQPSEAKRPAKGRKSSRPEWIDIVPSSPEQPEKAGGTEAVADSEADASAEQADPNQLTQKSGSTGPEMKSSPKEEASVHAAAENDKPLADERPGVGRKKAAELPHDGYSKPDASQKGCCGCVVM